MDSSRFVAIVVIQQAAESFTAIDLTIVSADGFTRVNDSIFETLMISFAMIMGKILSYCVAEGTLTEEDHSFQAFGFQ